MYLQHLNILQFKNCESAEITFSDKVNCLVGINGSGKTNILDAIYYLAFSKSFFNPNDVQNILNDEAYFSIQGLFKNQEGIEKITCSLKRGFKKAVGRNGKNYERFADHIGIIPLVMISPIDILLIIEGSEVRRKWLDGLISQFDKNYLDHLLAYNKALLQRNTLLKQMSRGKKDYRLMEMWDDHLVERALYIYEKRKELMGELASFFNEYYRYISDSREEAGILYTSHLDSGFDFREQLKESFEKDLRLLFTSTGIHKDDLEFLLDKRSVKKFASQGQQKSVLLSLRLSQARLISEKKQQKPLMLLDDIYDKLDSLRMSRLLQILNTSDFGQLFITDTNIEHMKSLLRESGLSGNFYRVENGGISQMEVVPEIMKVSN